MVRHLSPTSPATLPLPAQPPLPTTNSHTPPTAFHYTSPADLHDPSSITRLPPHSGEKVIRKLESMAGTGPEFDYPVTGKDEPIPVVGNEDPTADAGGAAAEPVVGEDAPELNDNDIADEERLQTREAGEWSEDMASNEPLPGEEVDPDLAEKLPSDRG